MNYALCLETGKGRSVLCAPCGMEVIASQHRFGARSGGNRFDIKKGRRENERTG